MLSLETTGIRQIVVDDLATATAAPFGAEIRHFRLNGVYPTGRFQIRGAKLDPGSTVYGVSVAATWRDESGVIEVLESQGLSTHGYLCAQPLVQYDKKLLRIKNEETRLRTAALVCATQLSPNGDFDVSALPKMTGNRAP